MGGGCETIPTFENLRTPHDRRERAQIDILHKEVLAQWQAIDGSDPLRDPGFRDQASWNALLLRVQWLGECDGGMGFRGRGFGAGGTLGATRGGAPGGGVEGGGFSVRGGAVSKLSGPALHELQPGAADA